MKIISDFHDYYDSAQAYGHDDRLIYRRETSDWTLTPRSWRHRTDLIQHLLAMPTFANLVPGLLLVCGRTWPLWRAQNRHWDREQDFSEVLPNTHPLEWWEQKLAEIESLPNSHPEYMRYRALLPSDTAPRWRKAGLSETLRKGYDARLGLRLGEDFLISERVPVALIVIDDRSNPRWGSPEDTMLAVIANPPLKDLGFPRHMDAFSLYQAIETFFGNQLAEVDRAPLRVGNDRIIAQQKGFDEMSFRTAAPGAKKENRKANRARKRGEPSS